MQNPVLQENEPYITVIIPVYNESENISELYNELRATLEAMGHTYEIIFIDDGSSDGTISGLVSLGEKDRCLKAISLKRNSGQSAAMKAGFDLAGGEIIITMDGDMQNDPADIPTLLDKLSEGFDVVCGWRIHRKDRIDKKVFSRISNSTRNLLIGDNIHDYGCTLRAYKKECVKDIDLFGEMHRYIPALMAIDGYLVGETTVNHRERRHGKTKYNWKRLLKGMTDLVVVTFWSRFATRPMHIFGTTGLAIMALGSIVSLYYIANRIMFGVALSDKPLFIMSLLSIIIGMQFIALGTLADISLRSYYHQKRYKNYRIGKLINFNDKNQGHRP